MIVGRWVRSTIREATIPITPGCHSVAGEDVGAAIAERADLRLGLPCDPLLDGAALRVQRVELAGDLGGSPRVLGEEQLERRVGAADAAGGVESRGEAEAEGARVERARIGARHGDRAPGGPASHSLREPGGPPERAGGSRREAGRGRRRWRAPRDQGPRPPSARRGPARACARPPSRTAPRTGSHRHPGG